MRKQYESWSKAKVKLEADKYKHKVDFKIGAPGAYNCAHRNGWLSSVCGHMVPKKSHQIKWTLEMITEEAIKYTRKIDFLLGSNRAYASASRRGLLEQVCKHMENR